MAEKSKAKKAKTISKKASPKARKSEALPVVEIDEEEDVEATPAPVIKRSKIGKIIARSSSLETNAEVAASDTDDAVEAERPPLEHKFSTADVHASPDSRSNDGYRQPIQKPLLESEQLNIKLSRSLTRKLREQAADEGIGLDEFIVELLSESVVLRAWEIVERKNQMKGGQPISNGRGSHSGGGQQQNRNSNASGGPRSNNNNSNNKGGGGHRGMNQSRYQNIMEDKASFLEYVRSQEKTRR